MIFKNLPEELLSAMPTASNILKSKEIKNLNSLMAWLMLNRNWEREHDSYLENIEIVPVPFL
jgi:hypothetical protein